MKRVELHTAQRVKPGHEHDYCVRDGLKAVNVFFGRPFPRLVGYARRLSRHISEEVVDSIWYPETDALEKGMAAVYIQTTEVWDGKIESEIYDFFDGGHYARTIKYEYSEGGKVSRTEYTNEHEKERRG